MDMIASRPNTTARQPSACPPLTEGAQALRRGIKVLRVLAGTQENGARLAEVAERCGLTRLTAHRLLQVLIEEGLVERLPDASRYVLGRDASSFGIDRPSAMRLRALAEPFLQHISDSTGDSVALTMRSGLDSICAASCIGRFPSRTAAAVVGARLPLGVGLGGLVILAFLPDEEAEDVMRQNATRLAKRKLTAEHLRERIAKVRSQGHAFTEAGVTPGTHVLAVPVFDKEQRPVAAINIHATAERLPAARAKKVIELIGAQARMLGQAYDRRVGGGKPPALMNQAGSMGTNGR